MGKTDGLIEMSVDSIRMHSPTQHYVVFLKEQETGRFLPIWIDAAQATSIAFKIQGMTQPRPMTHDLMINTLRELGVDITRVVVTELREDIYIARLHLRHGSRDVDLDCRSSDAIALAVRAECPIYVDAGVLERNGVPAEKDQEGEQEESENTLSEERLAVFRELVNNLDLPDLPDEPDGGKPSNS
ncbi:MAG TPA: bifunctional nuclease family protein [Candidatus Dormibacteraeota bacterium]|jgi:hypothetical protein|nr:bifunctional nuclease family protein [Candidatus Dormibacteraeota bacterium]